MLSPDIQPRKEPQVSAKMQLVERFLNGTQEKNGRLEGRPL